MIKLTLSNNCSSMKRFSRTMRSYRCCRVKESINAAIVCRCGSVVVKRAGALRLAGPAWVQYAYETERE